MFSRRVSVRHIALGTSLLIAVLLFLQQVVRAPFAPFGLGDINDFFLRPIEDVQAQGYRDSARLSTVLAHQPGFTVFQNVYWQNDTFYVITDQPWAVPNPEHIALGQGLNGVPPTVGAKVLAVRGPGISGHVREDRQLGTTIPLEDAVVMTAQAVDLPSPMIFNYDDQFVSHYYHWIGETFLGAWRIWNHHAYRSGLPVEDFATVAFRNMYELDEGAVSFDYEWEDHAGANRFFMETFFPGIAIESKLLWDERASSNTLFRMPLAIVTSRWAGHRGPSAAWKPWGDVLRMPVPADYLVNLRARVLKDYAGPVPLEPGPRPHVKYLSRQDTTRRLTDAAHFNLIRELQTLHAEQLVDLTILTFVDGDAFPDQLAEISTTDILVGVHGNGLTHSLWMTPGEGRAVFEIQPQGCSINDYGPLAMAAGVRHYLVTGDTMCTPLECPDRGCGGDPRGPNRDDITVDPLVIVHEIRRLVEVYWGKPE